MRKKIFDKHIMTYYTDGYKLAYSVLMHEQNSQDALHNAIEKAYYKKNQLKDMQKFKSWFLTIVINEARMLIRRNKKIIIMDHSLEKNTTEHNMEDQVMNRIIVEDYLKSISEEDRVIILMKYQMSMTFQDIGKILNIGENTVKSRFYRSIKKMQEQKAKGDEDNAFEQSIENL